MRWQTLALASVLGALLAVGAWLVLPRRRAAGEVGGGDGLPAGYARLAPTPLPAPTAPLGFRELGLRPTREYDFARREDVLAPRLGYVTGERALFAAFGGLRYAPSAQVFEQIQDGKPWWGLLGLSYYGRGAQSVEGDSEESRFIENPYLLVGLTERFAYAVHDSAIAPRAIYPRPLWLGFDESGRRGWVRYAAGDYFREAGSSGFAEARDRTLKLAAYNAVDLGLPYLAFDRRASLGVQVGRDDAFHEPEFIHTGGSCGYPGGCNNASPDTPDLVITVPTLPARLVVRLWRAAPASAAAAPDVWFVVELR